MVEDDGLGDWRIRAATRLASDLPATASGAPAHKAGARIAVITDTKAPDGTSVGFTTPSAAAMALNSAMRAVEQSQALRETFIYDEVKTHRGLGRAIRQERELFDYFELCMRVTIFSFQALEGFCYQTGYDDMKDPVQIERREEGRRQQ